MSSRFGRLVAEMSHSPRAYLGCMVQRPPSVLVPALALNLDLDLVHFEVRATSSDAATD